MIPISLADNIEWYTVDCTWYLEAIRGIRISKNPTGNNWYNDLKDRFSYVSSVAFSDKPEAKGRFMPLSQFFPLWDQCFKACGIAKLFPEDQPEHCLSVTEKLLTARYEILVEVYQAANLTSDECRRLLETIGNQIESQYNKLSQIGINREIVNRHHVYVCPYCGCTVIGNLQNQKFAANLDHFFPKKSDLNGIFSLSLFNLVPCCPTCNHTKRERRLKISPYDSNGKFNDVVFRYRPQDEVAFLKNPQCVLEKGEIDLLLTSEGKQKELPLLILDAPDKLYALGYGNDAITLGYADPKDPKDPEDSNVKYTWLKDVAIDFLLLQIKESRVYIEGLRKDFLGLPLSSLSVAAEYDTPSAYLRIPLSKLRHDLFAQMYETIKEKTHA